MKKELVDVVRKLKNYDDEKSKYIESIPSDISSAFFDNTYTNAQSMQVDCLMEALFGNMIEDVCWFLYEFKAGKSSGPHCILKDGTEYTFNTNEDYYDYLLTQGE